MNRVLITGITGMVGSHLTERYLEMGWEVHGTYRYRSDMENITHLLSKIKLHLCELRDEVNVSDLIKRIMPDRIHHLAASSFVRTSWAEPWEVMVNNVKPSINIFEAILKINNYDRYSNKKELTYNPQVHTALSSEELGNPPKEFFPMTEANPLLAESPYAVSKISADQLGYCYYKSYGLNAIQLLSFNMTGPRRGRAFVCSNFAAQVVDIEQGRQEPVLRVGNTLPIRDFTDVRDAVRGMILACEKCKPGERYVMTAENHISIQQVIDRLIELTTYTGEIQVITDHDKLRPSDVMELRGSSALFRETTGWKPQYDFFENTLPDILEYWRNKNEQRN